MGNDEGRILKELLLKEEQLLENSNRADAGILAELIEDNSIEFTASGKQNMYRTGELFGHIDGVQYIDSKTIRLIDLSENCKLLLYIAANVNKNSRVKTNCSSIWKKTNDTWKIVFHQGTLCSE